jgi:histone H3/H4
MQNLVQASQELFRRSDDERFPSLQALWAHCHQQKTQSQDLWQPPQSLKLHPLSEQLQLGAGDGASLQLNDWSFSQLCRLAGVSRDTVNRLSAGTAAQVFEETLPRGGNKPIQIFKQDDRVRSVHAASYTRLFNADLLMMVREFATSFEPPQPGMNGATGLYAGEQDMFCFLIDPTGWAEIDGQAFAPGFFLWNSEVGRRSVGISTFWFQAICQNHIVWDAVEVVEFTRKHTANVHDSLGEIRRIIEALVEKRDARRDGFVELMRKAMLTKFADDAEEATKLLTSGGFGRELTRRAIEAAQQEGRFTIFSIVDALTRLTQEQQNAGERLDLDQKAAKLLQLVA